MKAKTLLKFSAFYDAAEIDISTIKDAFTQKFDDEGNPIAIDKIEVGLAIVNEVARKLHRAEDEFYELMMMYKNITRAEAEESDAIDFIKEVFTDGDVKSFLS